MPRRISAGDVEARLILDGTEFAKGVDRAVKEGEEGFGKAQKAAEGYAEGVNKVAMGQRDLVVEQIAATRATEEQESSISGTIASLAVAANAIDNFRRKTTTMGKVVRNVGRAIRFFSRTPVGSFIVGATAIGAAALAAQRAVQRLQRSLVEQAQAARDAGLLTAASVAAINRAGSDVVLGGASERRLRDELRAQVRHERELARIRATGAAAFAAQTEGIRRLSRNIERNWLEIVTAAKTGVGYLVQWKFNLEGARDAATLLSGALEDQRAVLLDTIRHGDEVEGLLNAARARARTVLAEAQVQGADLGGVGTQIQRLLQVDPATTADLAGLTAALRRLTTAANDIIMPAEQAGEAITALTRAQRLLLAGFALEGRDRGLAGQSEELRRVAVEFGAAADGLREAEESVRELLITTPIQYSDPASVPGTPEFNRAQTEAAERTQAAWANVANTFATMIQNAESWRDVLQGVAALAVRFLGFLAGGGKGGIAGFFGFGGGNQYGGSVYPNTAYLVGERGPELFVPRQSGQIVRNDRLAGVGGNQVTVVLQPDASDSDARLDAWLERRLPEIERAVNPAKAF